MGRPDVGKIVGGKPDELLGRFVHEFIKLCFARLIEHFIGIAQRDIGTGRTVNPYGYRKPPPVHPGGIAVPRQAIDINFDKIRVSVVGIGWRDQDVEPSVGGCVVLGLRGKRDFRATLLIAPEELAVRECTVGSV